MTSDLVMVREVEVTVRHTRASKYQQRTVYVTRTCKPPAVVEVEVPDVVRKAGNTFLIPLRPRPPAPKPSYNLEFYVNNMRFTAKLSYKTPARKQQSNNKTSDKIFKEQEPDKRKLELPILDTENQSLLSNLGTENQSLLSNLGTENQSLLSNLGTENQSLLSNHGTENQSLLSNLRPDSLPPTTPRDDTTEFDLESMCSELELESLPSRVPSPADLGSPGESRKVPLIKLSSAPSQQTPPSGR